MRYDGFISYSHDADRELAVALQRVLQDIARPFYRRKALDIFRDETNLVANPALWPSIERALAASRTLIILASPEAAASIWCGREIAWWLAHRSVDSLYIVLSGGELVYDEDGHDFVWPQTSALPALLHGQFTVEPLYVDLRWTNAATDLAAANRRLRMAALPLAAALHGKQPQELESDDLREFRRARRVWRTAALVLVALTLTSIIAAWFAIQKSREAERERAIAVARQLAAESVSARIARPDALTRSVLLAVEAARRMQPHQTPSRQLNAALRDGLRMLPQRSTRLAHPKVVAFAVDHGEGRLISASPDGTILTWDLDSGQMIDGLETDVDASAVLVSPDTRLVALALGSEVVVVQPDTRQIVARVQHDRRVTAIAFSRDSRRLAVGAIDQKASVTELPNARELARFSHDASVEAVAFSDDGRLLATATGSMAIRLLGREPIDESAHVWQIDSGQRLARLPHDHIVEALAFNADASRLATGTRSGLARVWQIDGARELARMAHADGVDQIVFSPSNRYVASASGPYLFTSKDQSVKLWEADSGREVGEIVHQDAVNAVVFSPDGRWVASASDDHTIRLLRFPNREVMRLALDGPAQLVRFSADSRRLIVAGSALHILPVGPGYWPEPIAQDAYVSRLAVSSRGDLLTAVSNAKTLVVRRFGRPDPLFRIAHDDLLKTAVFSRDGRWLASAAGQVVQLTEAQSGNPGARLQHASAVAALAFSPDGRSIASSDADNKVHLWDTESGVEQRLLQHTGAVAALAFADRGGLLAGVTRDGGVRLWDPLSGEIKMSAALERDLQSVVISPDGRRVAVAGFDPRVMLWDTGSGQQLAELPHVGNVSDMRYIPDGRLSVATWDGRIRVWGADTLQLQTELRHDDTVNGLALSADGSLLASASEDRTARIYRTEDLRELARLTHPLAVSAVVFSPDARQLLVASGDILTPPHQLWAWPWRIDDLIAEACRRLPRNLTLSEWRRHLGEQPYRRTCNALPPHPSVLNDRLDRARRAVAEGQVDQAETLYAQLADDGHASDDVVLSNAACWFGSLDGFASRVLPLCERAVQLAPADGAVKDSRALARALSGDYSGAIDDFSAFVDWAGQVSPDSPATDLRRQWIDALRKGRNPFDIQTLARLRSEDGP